MSAERKSVKAALASSYAGPIAIALLLASGLDGFVIAVRDPIDALVCSGLNFFLRQAPTFSVRISSPMLSGTTTALVVGLSVLVFGCGLWMGTWLYPTANPAAHVAVETKD